MEKNKKDHIYDELIPIRLNDNFKNLNLFFKIIHVDVLRKKKIKHGQLLYKYKALTIVKLMDLKIIYK